MVEAVGGRGCWDGSLTVCICDSVYIGTQPETVSLQKPAMYDLFQKLSLFLLALYSSVDSLVQYIHFKII
jgi:hypothetical protein